MIGNHLVRVSSMGQVGRFRSVDGVLYPRHSRVVCRTARGLEVGQVLSGDDRGGESDGTVLRKLTVEDELLVDRLERRKLDAITACSELIRQRNMPTTLLDVEQLFDGSSIYFYFLGNVGPELESLTEELASTYDAAAMIQQFADTLTNGCGPGCGTEEATGNGCGTGGCSTCSVASACGSKRAAGT